jgi:hypothetical protein
MSDCSLNVDIASPSIITDFTDFSNCSSGEISTYISAFNTRYPYNNYCSTDNIDCNSPFNPNFTNAYCTAIQAKNYVRAYNNQCVVPKLQDVQDDMNKLINQTATNDDLTTATQLNNDTMKLYMNDYYYIIIKGIVYFIVLGLFIYFFGISNLIEGVKTTGNVLKDKAIIVKDKALELKDKVVPKETL